MTRAFIICHDACVELKDDGLYTLRMVIPNKWRFYAETPVAIMEVQRWANEKRAKLTTSTLVKIGWPIHVLEYVPIIGWRILWTYDMEL